VGKVYLISSVCIEVRPARLVKRQAALSGPMPFELRVRDAGDDSVCSDWRGECPQEGCAFESHAVRVFTRARLRSSLHIT
jgi:hypothetical protein